jgi:hypothetical protein
VEREVPEADALEQERDAGPEEEDEEVVPRRLSDDPEAPEADAYDQAQPVPVDDEDLHDS